MKLIQRVRERISAGLAGIKKERRPILILRIFHWAFPLIGLLWLMLTSAEPVNKLKLLLVPLHVLLGLSVLCLPHCIWSIIVKKERANSFFYHAGFFGANLNLLVYFILMKDPCGMELMFYYPSTFITLLVTYVVGKLIRLIKKIRKKCT